MGRAVDSAQHIGGKMRPIATNAATALAAEHPEVDLSALLNHCTAPYLGVAAVQADVDRLKHEAERKRKLDECQTMSHNALRRAEGPRRAQQLRRQHDAVSPLPLLCGAATRQCRRLLVLRRRAATAAPRS